MNQNTMRTGICKAFAVVAFSILSPFYSQAANANAPFREHLVSMDPVFVGLYTYDGKKMVKKKVWVGGTSEWRYAGMINTKESLHLASMTKQDGVLVFVCKSSAWFIPIYKKQVGLVASLDLEDKFSNKIFKLDDLIKLFDSAWPEQKRQK
ncbi:hypothetical protein HW115_17250 [Verrucomicrobiaceae bacterium N1E253]|uniref:Uncharacterized protein n=1 Tax=Oceaniferula marina TaxID=2748318 RepID=A0A851GRG9_9BACT|nr:hypothetical protein [Oceaniferula marina]NWK57370.1 hypothetical protein [Oceaniferula marina]